MVELDVKIVELPPMRVASVRAFGASPEMEAFEKMLNWARVHNLLTASEKPQFYGFNNPSPSAGSPNYGYEVWMTVGAEAQAEREISIKQFPGGLYAVSRVSGSPGVVLPSAWQQLAAWVEQSAYHPARHQWLEGHVNLLDEPAEEAMVFDLFLPVRK